MLGLVVEFLVAASIGLLFGNYLTSFYSRILQKKPINGFMKNGLKPHCDKCNHKLKFYEFVPPLSWITCGFSCNYCNAKIPKIYFMLEFIGTFLSITVWYACGFTNLYILVFLLLWLATLFIALRFR